MSSINIFEIGQNIARRYFVVNGFDGALAMLGIIMGFYVSDTVVMSTVINACMGAAIALGISGFSSAYISETAERKREFLELEQAMIRDLSESQQEKHSQIVPIFVATVNGLSPFLISLLILSPLFFANALVAMSFNPLQVAILVAFGILFLLGIFIGRISQTFWLWAGVRTLIVAMVTTFLIYLVSG